MTPNMKVTINTILKDTMKTLSLTNEDLSAIVNGKRNDSLYFSLSLSLSLSHFCQHLLKSELLTIYVVLVTFLSPELA